MKIGLDFDGVVTNLGKLKSFVAKKLFGVKVPHTKFDMMYAIENKILSALEYEELKRFVYYHIDAPLFMEPVRGALLNIHRLQQDGHEVKIVTARSGPALDVAKEWMKKNHLLHIPITGVGFGNSKREGVEGLDIFVDDYLIELYQVMDLVPNRFLFSWGYNQKFDEMGIAHRIHSWHKLYEEITKLEKVRDGEYALYG